MAMQVGGNEGQSYSDINMTPLIDVCLVLLIFAILAVVWVSAREWLRPARKPRPAVPEPAWRELLRISFGVIWIFDGLLQKSVLDVFFVCLALYLIHVQKKPRRTQRSPRRVFICALCDLPGFFFSVSRWAGWR